MNWSHGGAAHTLRLPAEVVLGWSQQQTAGALVSVGEGGGEADRRLLQASPPQRLPTAGTLRRDQETEDVLLTVSQPDHRAVHVQRCPHTPVFTLLTSAVVFLVFSPVTHLVARLQPVR